jgi:hypothetical protein
MALAGWVGHARMLAQREGVTDDGGSTMQQLSCSESIVARFQIDASNMHMLVFYSLDPAFVTVLNS